MCSLGDMFARWTSKYGIRVEISLNPCALDDIFKSTVHRAINKSSIPTDRYSIPLFFGTDYDVELEPISSCISASNPRKYDVITAGAYVKMKMEQTYAHVDFLPSQGSV